MSHMSDEIIVCARCKRPFIWSWGEQRFYKEHGLRYTPKYCPECRASRDDHFRSSQIDHPPYAAPLSHDGNAPLETPALHDVAMAVSQFPNQPTNQPNWWDNPVNRYNLLLFFLVLLALIDLWFIWQALKHL